MVKVQQSRQAPAKPVPAASPATPAVDVAAVAAKVRARSDAATVVTLANEMAATHAGTALFTFWFELARAAGEFQGAAWNSLTKSQQLSSCFDGVGAANETVAMKGARSQAETIAAKPAEKPRVVPMRNPEQAVADVLRLIDDALDDIEDLPSAAADFAESVEGTLNSIRETIEETGHVTEGQRIACENISGGIARWHRD